MLAQHAEMISNAYDLNKTEFRWEIPESSPSYPSLLLKCGLNGFQSVHFPSDVGHDSQETSFLASRDKTTKYRKPDF